jgi:hypothetical protein
VEARRGGERRPRPGDLVGDRRAGVRVEAGQVAAVQPQVLGRVADEVRQLEGDPEAREGLLEPARAEDRGHDPPDGGGRAVHVAVQRGIVVDPHGPAVHPHGVHVDAELAERQLLAEPGVHERGEDAMVRPARRQALVERRLPAVQRLPACRGGRIPTRAVDDLVRAAQEAVQGMDRGLLGPRQAPRGPVERGIVAALHPPAQLVRRADLHARILPP